MPPRYARTIDTLISAKSPSGRHLPTFSYKYEAVIELMLNEPALTLSDIARRLGKSPQWMTWITKSDAFRDLFERRRAEKSERVNQDLSDALTKVARRGIEILDERMAKNPNAVTLPQALEVVDKTLERLGYGVKLPGIQIDQSRIQQHITLSVEDFQQAQSVVRTLELDNARATGEVARALPDRQHQLPQALAGERSEPPEPSLASLLGSAFDISTPEAEDADEE